MQQSVDSAVPVVLFQTLDAANGKQIAIATLNVEKTLNALSMEMVELLSTQLQLWDESPNIAAVVLQAAGDKAFCAGGDLQKLYASMLEQRATPQKNDLLGNPHALAFFEQEYRLDYQIHSYRKPILCWGHGIVMGGGIGLMAGASHRVVTEKSRLAMPEISIGLFPDVAGSWFLNRMPGQLGLFLGLTGAAINASDAKFVKLADYQLPHASKAAILAGMQAQNWSEDASVNQLLLSALLLQAEQANGSHEHGPLRRHFDLINQLCASADLAQVVQQITQHVSEEAWMQKAIAGLKKGSPVSAWLAHALLQRCSHLSLAEVFRLELVAALACSSTGDFAEGIRALIIDKDQQPRWQHSSLAEINQDQLDQRYFATPWDANSHPLRDLGAATQIA
ncbi:enoyl-CoA hydratase/isomerase family protein [Undibacterium sp.]|uniref:enoyl-CoA hydratase/isomerase family protein n=1 Tax=Undibacterium sp. TaxID=1914977 RepID=UPI0025F3F96F|nr:enoyl-CoA hydratase/isomerase family protein [Undibacterium sp.]